MLSKLLFIIQLLILNITIFSQNYELLGPPGGSPIEIKVHDNYPENVYCTVREGGFFRSKDGGVNTTYIESGMADYNILEITYDPFNPDIFYFGAEYVYYKTENNGENWEVLYDFSEDPDRSTVQEIEINPHDSKKIYLTNGGKKILKSDDSGETWRLLKIFDTDITEIGLSDADTSIIYAAADGYFHKSTNSGKDWEMTYDFGATGLRFFKVEINPNEPNSIYAWQSGRLIKSNNGGKSFQVIKNNAYYFAIDPNDTSTVFATSSDGLQKSADGGLNWQTLYNSYPVFRYMTVNPKNTSEFYCGAQYFGVYKSTDSGQSWFKSNLSYGQIFNLKISNDSRKYLIGTGGTKIQKTTDGGATWFRPEIDPDDLIQGLSYNFFELDPFNENNGYLCGVNHFYKTTDMGTTWFDTGILAGANEVRYHQYDEGTIFMSLNPNFATGSRTYRSVNGGEYWEKLSQSSFISRLRFNNVDKDLIYYFDYEIIYGSTNSGNTWRVIATGLESGEDFVQLTELKCRSDKPEILYASQQGVGTILGFLAKSNDGGETWERIDTNLISRQHFLKFSSFWLDENNDKRIIAGLYSGGQPKTDNYSPGGLYLTEDDGQTWTELYKGEVNLVKVDNSEPRNILFGTKFGLMRLPDTTKVTGIDERSETVKEFQLSQNYPNPFNPTTKIEYRLSKSGWVNLRVYNLLGEEISQLVNQYQKKGKYSINFSGENHPSGIYFYQIQSNEYKSVKKMILLR